MTPNNHRISGLTKPVPYFIVSIFMSLEPRTAFSSSICSSRLLTIPSRTVSPSGETDRETVWSVENPRLIQVLSPSIGSEIVGVKARLFSGPAHHSGTDFLLLGKSKGIIRPLFLSESDMGAFLTWKMASSRSRPYVITPGRDGISAIHRPSVSRSVSMANITDPLAFISASLPNRSFGHFLTKLQVNRSFPPEEPAS